MLVGTYYIRDTGIDTINIDMNMIDKIIILALITVYLTDTAG